jgi:hypothetical protein
MSENLVERYLIDIGEVRSTRSYAPETSFYPALEGLLTAIGKTLSPKIGCISTSVHSYPIGIFLNGAASIKS